MFGNKTIAALEARIAAQDAQLAALQSTLNLERAEYRKLVDRLCAKTGVPESPKEVREWVKEQVESSDLFQEAESELESDDLDPRADNREPVDSLVG